MTSFFPDVNVWLALSDRAHTHSEDAWRWLSSVGDEDRLIFSRFTQMSLLRLLTHESVMRESALTVGRACGVFDAWLADPRVDLFPGPRGFDAAFRAALAPFASVRAPKAIADCFLLAFAQGTGSVLVTMDKALAAQSRRAGHPALLLP